MRFNCIVVFRVQAIIYYFIDSCDITARYSAGAVKLDRKAQSALTAE